jgi:hypothetical protein
MAGRYTGMVSAAITVAVRRRAIATIPAPAPITGLQRAAGNQRAGLTDIRPTGQAHMGGTLAATTGALRTPGNGRPTERRGTTGVAGKMAVGSGKTAVGSGTRVAGNGKTAAAGNGKTTAPAGNGKTTAACNGLVMVPRSGPMMAVGPASATTCLRPLLVRTPVVTTSRPRTAATHRALACRGRSSRCQSCRSRSRSRHPGLSWHCQNHPGLS